MEGCAELGFITCAGSAVRHLEPRKNGEKNRLRLPRWRTGWGMLRLVSIHQ